jgi:hypothetical protein
MGVELLSVSQSQNSSWSKLSRAAPDWLTTPNLVLGWRVVHVHNVLAAGHNLFCDLK